MRGNKARLSPKDKLLIAYEKGYRVTEDGRLLGIRGEIGIRFRNRKNSPIKSTAEYPVFFATIEGRSVTIRVHRLAAYCFYGDRLFDSGIQVRHLNANRLDVSRNNIALGTQSDNEAGKTEEMRERQRRSVIRRRLGQPSYTQTIKDENVFEIYRRVHQGELQKDLAREFGVAQSTVSMIKTRTYFKHLLGGL